MKSDHFLNRGVLIKQKIKKWLLLSLGWVLTGFSNIGFMTYLDRGDEKAYAFLAMVFMSLIYLACGIYLTVQLHSVNRFISIFEGDQNGFISLDELANQTGMDRGRVIKRLDKLFRIGIFKNCSFDRGGNNPGVLLNDANADNKFAGFVNVQCPACGGTSRIRVGTVGKCEYCGSPITR